MIPARKVGSKEPLQHTYIILTRRLWILLKSDSIIDIIDYPSAIVGGPSAVWEMALNAGENQYTDPAFSAKACFMVSGNITTNVNKGRWAGPMSGLLI